MLKWGLQALRLHEPTRCIENFFPQVLIVWHQLARHNVPIHVGSNKKIYFGPKPMKHFFLPPPSYSSLDKSVTAATDNSSRWNSLSFSGQYHILPTDISTLKNLLQFEYDELLQLLNQGHIYLRIESFQFCFNCLFHLFYLINHLSQTASLNYLQPKCFNCTHYTMTR